MSLVDLWLLLAASLGHATWNAISRSIIHDRDRFYTVIMLMGLVIYGPLALGAIFQVRHVIDVMGWIVGAAFFEMAYFFCLAKAYEQGSFLSAYPIARGSSPLITALLSIMVFGIPLSGASRVGIVLVAMGIFGINQTSLSVRELPSPVCEPGYALGALNRALYRVVHDLLRAERDPSSASPLDRHCHGDGRDRPANDGAADSLAY